MIQFSDVSLSFQQEQIFSNFNLQIKQGENICITGESGKGKSTLLKVMMGFVLPDSGAVKLDGLTVSEKNIKTIRGKITWIPQNVNLPVKNGHQLIELLCLEENKKQIQQYFLQLGLNDSYLKKDFSEISGGQKQRVIIGICLCIDTPILLLDEPTSSLDDNSIQLLIKTIKKQEGRTIVSASHNASWMQSADHIIELK